jgi:hypothetical protein
MGRVFVDTNVLFPFSVMDSCSRHLSFGELVNDLPEEVTNPLVRLASEKKRPPKPPLPSSTIWNTPACHGSSTRLERSSSHHSFSVPL